MPVSQPVVRSSDKVGAEPRGPAHRSTWHTLAVILRALQVRLRFLLVLAVAFVVIGQWDVLRNYWERLTRGGTGAAAPTAVSTDTEYFCPMCPGVLSDWPSKCPVCNMALVPRHKGEAVPLPNGVVARMQLSPYRVQLAGIRTSVIVYRPLAREIVTAGFVEPGPVTPMPTADIGQVSIRAEVLEKELPFLTEGQAVEVTSDVFPGHAPFLGKVQWV